MASAIWCPFIIIACYTHHPRSLPFCQTLKKKSSPSFFFPFVVPLNAINTTEPRTFPWLGGYIGAESTRRLRIKKPEVSWNAPRGSLVERRKEEHPMQAEAVECRAGSVFVLLEGRGTEGNETHCDIFIHCLLFIIR